MYLGKGRKLCAAAVREEWDNGRNNSSDAKVSEGEGRSALGDGEDHVGTDIHLWPSEKTVVRQTVPQTHEEHVGADNHLQHMNTSMLEQAELPWRKLQPEVIDHFITPGIEFDQVHFYKDIFDANGDITISPMYSTLVYVEYT